MCFFDIMLQVNLTLVCSMEIFLFWVVMAVVVAVIANSKGKDGFGWLIYGFIIWPIALVHILVSSATPESIEKKAAAEGRIPCPHCAELIKREAKLCPHCQQNLGSFK